MSDLQIRHSQTLEESHHGRPAVIALRQTGRPGRPQIVFDADFLAWAYNRRSISALARFLGVGRTTLRNALHEHGILGRSGHVVEHPELRVASAHFAEMEEELTEEGDDLLEPTDITRPVASPDEASVPNNPNPAQHYTISDDDLDDLLIRLRSHYRRAGINMLNGMLRRLGYRIQQERIRMSLLRIDPVRRVFERIRIRRRHYSVAGPNALWHHDGQHGASYSFMEFIEIDARIYERFDPLGNCHPRIH